jgi:CheY-like chemotaxis protein
MGDPMAKILVVDDEEMDRVLERTILEAAGHQLFFAHEGKAALKVCEDIAIDLVITDLAMPDFNGLRFIKELREEGVEIPIIAVSGRAPDQLDLAESYGADLALVKPLDGDELLKAVNRVLEETEDGVRVLGDPWKKGRYR